MKDFLSKYGTFLLAAIPLFNAFILVFLFLFSIQMEDRIKQIQEEVSCEYFTNVQEWDDGELVTYLTSENAKSAKELMALYRQQISAQTLNGCTTNGPCLDSSRVVLYKDCVDYEAIEIVQDTMIYF